MTSEDATQIWAERRSLLFTIAYELLGSAADAEDVVQETWLRWSGVDLAEVANPRAYLAQIVTRLALNRVRTVARRRETYVGPWLPEPLLTAPDIVDDVLLADSVSTAMLVVLESLSSLERAVFVLREVFAFEYDEIALGLGRSSAAVRQLAKRARDHVAERRPAQVVDPGEHEAALRALTVAMASGDVETLLAVVSPDVQLVSDGGGLRSAARRPVLGADKVARFLLGIVAGLQRDAVGDDAAQVSVEFRTVNGGPAVVLLRDGDIDSVMTIGHEHGVVTAIYVVRNPEKLTRLDAHTSLAR